jgi:hypothetical protein
LEEEDQRKKEKRVVIPIDKLLLGEIELVIKTTDD